ncbi:MAG TPA: hypothetical protein VE091_13145, partial [Gemmatimonadales bacterium]|nr:hypothetical protein [Gemmatimonadales bacterium]
PHLAAASGVALELDLDLLPLAPSVRAAAGELGIGPAQFAAEGGEDYELLVTLPAEFAAADELRAECGIPLTRIGSVGAGAVVRLRLDGVDVPLAGFDHFH